MIRSVLALALLALAIAASAQTSLSIAPSDARSIYSSTSTPIPSFKTGLTAAYSYTPRSMWGPAFYEQYRWQVLFPLSGLTPGTTIQSATITTSLLPGSGGSPTAPPTLYCRAYGSRSATLTTDWPTSMTALAAPGIRTWGAKTIDATAAVRADLVARTPYFGLLVAIDGQGTTGWSTPTLTVTYAPVPEPSALAALGLGALALLRRRRAA